MKKYPKVLVASYFSDLKEYALYDFLAIIKNLTYPNYDIYLVDNSKDIAFHKVIRTHGFDCDYVNPDGRMSREYMTECLNVIRDRVLKGGYDYLMMIESDLYPPLDVVDNLLIHSMPVTAYAYMIYTGEGSSPMLSEVEDDIAAFDKDYNTRILDNMAGFDFMNGDIRKSHSCGLGCCLIQRWILEKIKFRIDDEYQSHADEYFHKDVLVELGIQPYVDTSMIVNHWNKSWLGVPDNYREFFGKA